MKLHFEAHGPESAATIVFLHGLGVSSWMWTDQVGRLSSCFRCVTVDLPGNGESHRSPWTSLESSADDVAALIRELSGTAHVVGLSLGGYVTLEMLARHPDVVERAVVSGVTDRPLRPRWLYAALGRGMGWALRQRWVVRLSAKLMQLPAEVVPLYERDARRLESRTVRRIYDQVLVFTPPEALTPQAGRLLVLAGDKEARPIRDALETFAVTVPGATTRRALRAHHAWNTEHPELFSDTVSAWCRSEPLPTELELVSSPAAEALRPEPAA